MEQVHSTFLILVEFFSSNFKMTHFIVWTLKAVQIITSCDFEGGLNFLKLKNSSEYLIKILNHGKCLW
jgi:hypothetical protein